jgi:hypothetical protein
METQTSSLSFAALTELLDSLELAEALSEPCECGAPRVLSLGLDSIVCSDSRCSYRIATRLYNLYERFVSDGALSLTFLVKLCQNRSYLSWLDFFTDEWDGDDGAAIFDVAREQIMDTVKDEFDVALAAALSGFDAISNESLYALCGDSETVSDFADAIDREGIEFVAERLGLTEAHLLPAAIHIFNRLAACLGEMLEIEEIFFS